MKHVVRLRKNDVEKGSAKLARSRSRQASEWVKTTTTVMVRGKTRENVRRKKMGEKKNPIEKGHRRDGSIK